MPIKAVLFDLFHTLVDVASAPGASGRYTADILGLDRARWSAACFSHVHEICRPTEHREIIRALAHSIDPTVSEARIEEATGERQRRFDHALMSVEAEVLLELGRLRERGLRLGLVSNASTGEVKAWEHSPLAPLFDTAVFSWECGSRKPEPAIYRHALTRLGVRANEALFVGDGGSDEHRGARAVGLAPVLLTRHIASRMPPERLAERAVHCETTIGRVADLLALLDKGELST